jgi:hypothetical protein
MAAVPVSGRRSSSCCISTSSRSPEDLPARRKANALLVAADELSDTCGPHRERVPIAAGQAVCWERGEEHETGIDTGLTAVVLEGDDLSVGAAAAGSGT